MTDINVTIGTDPINVSISGGVVVRNFVDADEQFRLDGINGDSYLVYNSTTNKIELFVDGVQKAAWG